LGFVRAVRGRILDSLHPIECKPRFGQRAARKEKLQVLAAWFDATANRTHARLCKKGKLAADFAAVAKGDVPIEVVSFKSSAHRKTLLK
jgi:hypothetical protein